MKHGTVLAASMVLALVLGVCASLYASSQIGAGVIDSVKDNGYTYMITYNWYLSGTGPGLDKCPYKGKPQPTEMKDTTHCLLNGSFITRAKFMETVQVGLRHSMFSNRHHFEYPCIWTRDLDAVIGTLKSASPAALTVVQDVLNPQQKDGYPSCPLTMEREVGLCGEWTFVLDGKRVEKPDDLPQGAWVSVYPTARPQTVEVRTPDSAVSPPFAGGEFDKCDQTPYVHTAFGLITEVNADGSYVLRGKRDGKMQDIPFSERIKDGVTLNGFFVPRHRAIRVGRWAAACCYRKRDFPNQLMVTDPGSGAVEGKIASLEGRSLTVSVDQRLGGGRKRIVLEDSAVFLLDGKPSTRTGALQAGARVTVLPARPPSVIAETPLVAAP